jgi:DNA invertase Pin-like site-specific DNA recombinase
MPLTETRLTAKNPAVGLTVIVLGRISTVYQNVESIEASHQYVQAYLSRIYDGPLKLHCLGEQASGLLADRASIREAETLIASGQVDLVIAEDLGRIYRNPRHQYDFVQNAVDKDVRVICIGDHLDTADENWEVMMGAAALRHGLYIPDTRRRVNRTATHSFHQGGMVQKVRYGYRRLTKSEAESGEFGPRGLRIARLSECTPVIREMAQRISQGQSLSEVARWLREIGVEPGPYVTGGRWTARGVRDLLYDPILRGQRSFRKTVSKQIYRSGKYRRLQNPNAPESHTYPELAHLTAAEQDKLWCILDERQQRPRSKSGREHPRFHIARSDSIWPGQHARCTICGEYLYWTLNRQLKCKDAFSRTARCWNHVQVQANQVYDKVLPRLLAFCEAHVPFRNILIEAAWSEFQNCDRQYQRDEEASQHEAADLEKRRDNLVRAIEVGGDLNVLVEQLQKVQDRLDQLAAEAAERQAMHEQPFAFLSRDDVDSRLDAALLAVAQRSFRFAALMRQFIPVFLIQPVQALDSGQVRPRAKMTFQVPPPGTESSESEPLRFELVVDLFDPPLHIAHASEVRQYMTDHPGATLKAAGKALGLGHMTVKRARDYASLMGRAGIDSPYRELLEQPAHASRWKPRKAKSANQRLSESKSPAQIQPSVLNR